MVGACFDSDEKFRAAEPATTTGPPPMMTTGTPEPETSTGPTTGDEGLSCREGVGCIFDCIFELIQSTKVEPDLSCILVCSESMTVRDAYDLLSLANCTSDYCEEIGCCATEGETTTGGDVTSTGGSGSGSGSDTGSSTTMTPEPGTSTTGEDICAAYSLGGLVNECLGCTFTQLREPDEGVCTEFQEACN